MHVNVRSPPKNKEKMEFLFFFSVINFTGNSDSYTKLNFSSCHLAEIESYQFVHSDSVSIAGGVGIYIRNDLNFVINSQLSINNQDSEALFIEILNTDKSTKQLIVGVVYRHSGNNYSTFQAEVVKVLQTLNHSKYSCVLLGDYNIDLITQHQEVTQETALMISMQPDALH